MPKVAVKSDDYTLTEKKYNEDNYSKEEFSVPPEPDAPLPGDPQHYSTEPKVEVYKLDKKESNDEASDEDFVFWEGKPVLYVGYYFSDVHVTDYERKWPIDEDGHLKPKNPPAKTTKPKLDADGNEIKEPFKPIDPKQAQKEETETGEEDLVVCTEAGCDFVFIDDIPMTRVTDPIGAYGEPAKMEVDADEDGKPDWTVSGSKKMDGKFKEEFKSNVFIDS